MATQVCFPPHVGLPFDYLPPTVDGQAEWELGLSKPAAAQNITITGNPTGGTFVLSSGGSNSTPINFDADAAGVQTALRVIAGLPNALVGGANPHFTLFVNGASPVALLTLQTNSLTGGAAPSVAIADITPATNVIETGWTESARETQAYAGASGVPAMSFQAVKHNSQDVIYLSFVARVDLTYDDLDAIMVVLQPTFSAGSHPAGTRRLLIRPNLGGIGAGVTGTSDPGATDFTDVILGPSSQTASFPVRFNHPVNATVVALDATGNPTGAEVDATTVPGLSIRAKSWTLSNVDLNWSVELQIPTKNVLGSGANLANSFGLYCNLLRFGTSGDVINFQYVTEFPWPPESAHLTGNYAGLQVIPIAPGLVGQASMGAGCQGVGFASPWGSVGVKSGASVTSTIDGAPGVDNVMVAELINDGPTNAADVRASFRLADFGIGPGGAPDWDSIPATNGTSNPTPGASVASGGATTELSMQWTLTAGDRAKYMAHGGDQCLWVLLDSDQSVMFKESSHRENLSFKNLSEVDQDVVVSGKGHGPTADGGPTYDFLLTTAHRLLASTVNYDGWTARPPGTSDGGLVIKQPPGGDGNFQGGQLVNYGGDDHAGQTVPLVAQKIFNQWAGNSDVNYTWVAITTAYRRTSDSLTVGGKDYPIFSVVDSFSHVLTHQGEPATFVHSMDGDGLQQIGDGLYALLVPYGGEVVLKVKYSTDVPPPLSPADKFDIVEDALETAAQRLASKADAVQDAIQRVLHPGQPEK